MWVWLSTKPYGILCFTFTFTLPRRLKEFGRHALGLSKREESKEQKRGEKSCFNDANMFKIPLKFQKANRRECKDFEADRFPKYKHF